MYIGKYFLLFLLVSVYVSAYYYQVLDEYSFNLKIKQDKTTFYNNFIREGNVLVHDRFIKLTPNVNNTYGLFYTKEVA